MQKIRIVLVDDHQLMREGLTAICRAEPDLEVVGQAEDGERALAVTTQVRPDVVVMDVALGEHSGIEATRQLCAQGITKVLALSTHADKRYVRGMLEAGAVGYVLKAAAFTELRQALQTVVSGRVYLSPGLGLDDTAVRDATVGHERAAVDLERLRTLSPREREVLQLLAEGVTSGEIARRLHRSIRTVDSHRASIMRKLDLHSVAELTKYAVRAGLTSLE
ncbi:MAG: response regulator [Planctomycetota bacterium]